MTLFSHTLCVHGRIETKENGTQFDFLQSCRRNYKHEINSTQFTSRHTDVMHLKFPSNVLLLTMFFSV